MKITLDMITEMIHMVKDGDSSRTIAKKLNIDRGTVAVKLHKHFPNWKEFQINKQKLTPGQEKTIKKSIEETENINTKEIKYKTNEEIKTLNQLVKECEIDLNIWNIPTHKINKWGNINNLSFQVKATMVKKKPDEVQFPVLKSVHFNIKHHQKSVKRPERKIKKALVFGDSQNGFKQKMYSDVLIPLHDRRAWDIILKVAKMEQVEKIILLGDMLDLTDFSDKFIVSPEFSHSTQSALIELGWYLSTLRKLQPHAEIVYVEGNHEERLMRSILNNFRSGYGLMAVDNLTQPIISIDRLLNLSNLNIQYVGDYPNGKYWINDNLVCKHGDVAVSGNGGTVSKMLKDARNSTIIGHIHKIEKVMKTVFNKEKEITYAIESFGCICRIDGIVPAKKGENDWQQGLGIVDYTDEGLFNTNDYSINNGSSIINGKFIEGKSNIEQIYKDTKWELFK